MMSILFDLPSDLSISILREWLVDLKSIVALDSAAARSVRRDYLGMISHRNFVLMDSMQDEIDATEYVHWVNYRSMKLGSLSFNAAHLEVVAKISFFLLEPVRELLLTSLWGDDEEEDDDEVLEQFSDCATLYGLLKLLPSLTSVDMSTLKPVDNKYLTKLRLSGLPLKNLILDNDIETCDGTKRLLKALHTTLEALVLGTNRKIDAAMLQSIASTCRNIKVLEFTCGDISISNLTTALASSHLSRLERLTVLNRGSTVLSDELALAIFQHHRILTAFVAEDAPISIATCATGMEICANISCLVTGSVGFEVRKPKLMHPKFAEIQLSQQNGVIHDSHVLSTNVNKIFQLCKTPLYSLSFQETGLIEDNDLIEVIKMAGKDVRMFGGFLNATANDNVVVQHLCENFPLLETFAVHNWDCVTDDGLIRMADSFKHLKTIYLHSDFATRITDFGMSYLLHKMGSSLESLVLNADFEKLTTATLLTIIEVCTSLTTLGLIKTAGITIDSLTTHLIVPNALPTLTSLQVEAADVENLRATLSLLHVDERWAAMLKSNTQ